MKIRYQILIIFLFVNVFVSAEYHVDKSKDNLVKFISDAPMEDFEGVTDKIDGYIYWEGENFLQNSEMYFEVDLNSLDTGIGLRNRHMRENYLETDKFPFTHFTGKLIKAEKLSEKVYQVTAQGKMFIHGVENEMTVEGEIIRQEEGFRIQTNFITPLSDYKIKIPRLMFYKIDENMKVELDFFIMKAAEENK